MIEILKAAVQRGASDVHIKAGDVVRARIGGDLVPLTKDRLSPEQTREVVLGILPGESQRARVDDITDLDCSFGAPGVGRFRVNVYRQRGAFSVVLRVIPFEVPTVAELGLPPVLSSIALSERGMVLVTGVTGSGKSTTLAGLVSEINRQQRKHIITLEDPIEFLHRDVQSSVTQREVGSDTRSFSVGLRAALREDPDVVLVGEMRDTETIDTALKAAETGHLVMSTLHTPDAVKTISRVVSVFPPYEQAMVRVRLAESLLGVISQRLLPRKSGRGRIAACEIMIVTGAIREAIMEPSRWEEIDKLIAEGRDQYGSQTFDQHLMELVAQDLVSYEVALAAASNPGDFELRMRTLA
jgi:twitching motility protein PilT